jgi:hypothetical protein
MPYRANYPENLADVLDPPVVFRRETVMAVRRFARRRPWRGNLEERKGKLERLHRDLCSIYGKQTTLRFGVLDGTDSGSSFYSPTADEIVLTGRVSIVTFFHEFAHSLGKDERQAVRWSVNLYRLCFPRSFSRSIGHGHMVRRPPNPRT